MRISKGKFTPKTPVTEWRARGNGSERFIGAGGEINASSKEELMQQIGGWLNAVQSGTVARNHNETLSFDAQRQQVQARAEVLADALEDRSGDKWKVLGETMAEEIYETLGREGFTRKVLGFKPIKKGDQARISIRKKDVIAYYFANTNPTVVASSVRQSYIYPQDAYITANIVIDDLELELADTDLLEHKYNDGLEQILREEDKRTKFLFDASAATYNELVFFTNFTPSVFQAMRTQISRWALPVAHALISVDIWNDITTDTEFASYYDPVSKHELIQQGNLGSFFGINFLTDGFRYDTLRVLDEGEVYFLGVPKTLGVLMERMPLTVESVNGAVKGEPTKGWFMKSIVSHAVVNPRSIVKGNRV